MFLPELIVAICQLTIYLGVAVAGTTVGCIDFYKYCQGHKVPLYVTVLATISFAAISMVIFPLSYLYLLMHMEPSPIAPGDDQSDEYPEGWEKITDPSRYINRCRRAYYDHNIRGFLELPPESMNSSSVMEAMAVLGTIVTLTDHLDVTVEDWQADSIERIMNFGRALREYLEHIMHYPTYRYIDMDFIDPDRPPIGSSVYFVSVGPGRNDDPDNWFQRYHDLQQRASDILSGKQVAIAESYHATRGLLVYELCDKYFNEFNRLFELHKVDAILTSQVHEINSIISTNARHFLAGMEAYKTEFIVRQADGIKCLDMMDSWEEFLLRMNEFLYRIYDCDFIADFLKEDAVIDWSLQFDSPKGGIDTYDEITQRQKELIALRGKTKCRPK